MPDLTKDIRTVSSSIVSTSFNTCKFVTHQIIHNVEENSQESSDGRFIYKFAWENVLRQVCKEIMKNYLLHLCKRWTGLGCVISWHLVSEGHLVLCMTIHFLNLQMTRSDIRAHIKWAVSLVTLIFLRGLCGYVWINIYSLYRPRGWLGKGMKN